MPPSGVLEKQIVAHTANVILLVVYVGIVALSRGITKLFFAFKVKDMNKRIAAG